MSRQSLVATLMLIMVAGCSLLPGKQPAAPPAPLPTPAAAVAATARPVEPPPPTAQPAPAEPPAATASAAASGNGATVEPAKPLAMTWIRKAAYRELPGWQQDNPLQAWPALLTSCLGLKNQPLWKALCESAQQAAPATPEAARNFLEARLQPYQILQPDGDSTGLATGYYEPLLRGSRVPTAHYRYPLHGPPDDLLVIDLAGLYPELKNMRLRGRLDGRRVVPYYNRSEIENGHGALRGRELLWVDDAVELFFLQVQGSGRVLLESGEVVRIGYADQNGHPYRSIGKWLVEQGELTLDKASMQGIKDWGRRNPQRLPELLQANPSYVFFRELDNSLSGPLGAMGLPLTAERSIAVDPRAIPLGAPVWLATTRPNSDQPLQRLVLAQDTGGAIRGNVRLDYFWGFGDEAGRLAGAMKQKANLWVLLPHGYATNGNDNPSRSGL